MQQEGRKKPSPTWYRKAPPDTGKGPSIVLLLFQLTRPLSNYGRDTPHYSRLHAALQGKNATASQEKARRVFLEQNARRARKAIEGREIIPFRREKSKLYLRRALRSAAFFAASFAF